MAKAMKAALAAIGVVAAMSAQAGSYGGDDKLAKQCVITTSGGPVVSYIGAQFDYLEAEIYAGEFTNGRDRTGMLGKLSEAAQKVRAKKLADASVKLQDIHDKADTLASAAKPKLVSADGIMEAAALAKECVDNTI
ncbi:hypothetical protein [uncultured Piscinibacter sp.]|uniref:hypothetical protein n=1 Tax=uncultured Piscinibacter sp. TaxID=1131835 RepID=UPI0026073537|nr:hypothetical protein [uncultured Piscinibacter sp.]